MKAYGRVEVGSVMS